MARFPIRGKMGLQVYRIFCAGVLLISRPKLIETEFLHVHASDDLLRPRAVTFAYIKQLLRQNRNPPDGKAIVVHKQKQ